MYLFLWISLTQVHIQKIGEQELGSIVKLRICNSWDWVDTSRIQQNVVQNDMQ